MSGAAPHCPCDHADRRAPRTVSEAVALARHRDAVTQQLEPIERAPDKWMSVLRCRQCGQLWAEDSVSSGHADLLFVYPIETDDPHEWLARAASIGSGLDRSTK